MAYLNLMLYFNDLGESERVVWSGPYVFFCRRTAFSKCVLSCRRLLSVWFRAHGRLTDSAIVLLEHTCGFQQFLKTLLVETWFFFLVGHSFSWSLQPAREAGRAG